MSEKTLLRNISLTGLEVAPFQVWGSVRIVPLIRRSDRGDLRLSKRSYDEDFAIVSLEGEIESEGVKYFSYVPHGLILSWNDDGSPVAVHGGQLSRKKEGKLLDFGIATARLLHRMAKRESKRELRFLPLHLSMEGFLSMFFSGPDIAWTEYSRYALSHGLGFRCETAYMGRYITGLENALRVFEIHPNQVGMIVFVADALASAFVVPNRLDYRVLHTSLLEDFFGELLYQYGMLHSTTYPMQLAIDESQIEDLASLRTATAKLRSEWAAFQGFMAEGLLGKAVLSRTIYSAGPFTLQRFITDLNPREENHIGEAIVRDNGELEYLKTYRLSAAQTRRVYLLSKLAEHNWNLDATAAELKTSREELIGRFEKTGFGYLLKDSVRQAALKKRRS